MPFYDEKIISEGDLIYDQKVAIFLIEKEEKSDLLKVIGNELKRIKVKDINKSSILNIREYKINSFLMNELRISNQMKEYNLK